MGTLRRGRHRAGTGRLFTDARVVVMDTDARKVVRALDLGADEVSDAADALEEESFRAILDFVGTDDSLAMAARVVERNGVVVQDGEGGGVVSFGHSVAPLEATFRTSISGSREDAIQVLDLARSGQITWEVESVPLQQINDAIARLRRGDVISRLVIVP